jgi:hypothetical protein
LSGFSELLLRHSSGRNIAISLALTIASFALMAAVLAPAFQQATGGLRPFDLNFGISAESMYRDLPAYTDQARWIYLGFAAADYVYPAAAATFFALLWAWMFRRVSSRLFDRLAAAGMLGFPFLFALIDWLENAGFLFVTFSYPAEYPGVATLAGSLKAIKPLVEAVILLLTLLFAGNTLRLARRRPEPPE